MILWNVSNFRTLPYSSSRKFAPRSRVGRASARNQSRLLAPVAPSVVSHIFLHLLFLPFFLFFLPLPLFFRLLLFLRLLLPLLLLSYSYFLLLPYSYLFSHLVPFLGRLFIISLNLWSHLDQKCIDGVRVVARNSLRHPNKSWQAYLWCTFLSFQNSCLILLSIGFNDSFGKMRVQQCPHLPIHKGCFQGNGRRALNTYIIFYIFWWHHHKTSMQNCRTLGWHALHLQNEGRWILTQ